MSKPLFNTDDSALRYGYHTSSPLSQFLSNSDLALIEGIDEGGDDEGCDSESTESRYMYDTLSVEPEYTNNYIYNQFLRLLNRLHFNRLQFGR